MKSFFLGWVILFFLFSINVFAGELQEKQRNLNDLKKDLRIVELEMQRDTALLNGIKERAPRLQRERIRLREVIQRLEREIMALEEAQKNEKDTAGSGDNKPAPDNSAK